MIIKPCILKINNPGTIIEIDRDVTSILFRFEAPKKGV